MNSAGTTTRAVFIPELEDTAVQLSIHLSLHAGSAALGQQAHCRHHQVHCHFYECLKLRSSIVFC